MNRAIACACMGKPSIVPVLFKQKNRLFGFLIFRGTSWCNIFFSAIITAYVVVCTLYRSTDTSLHVLTKSLRKLNYLAFHSVKSENHCIKCVCLFVFHMACNKTYILQPTSLHNRKNRRS